MPRRPTIAPATIDEDRSSSSFPRGRRRACSLPWPDTRQNLCQCHDVPRPDPATPSRLSSASLPDHCSTPRRQWPFATVDDTDSSSEPPL